MRKSNLSWTKYSPLEDETSILDPLALDYFAQVLGNIILPSFTTRTSRARYYSMVCYGIDISKRHLESLDQPYYEKDILEMFKMYEKFWASSIVHHYKSNRGGIGERDGKERGLRGKRGAITANRNSTISLGDDYKLLTRQLELGGLGAYRSSMESLELIDQDLNLTHKGLRLAKDFVDNNTNNKIVLKSIKGKKIVKKQGMATLNSFGYHVSLDGFSFNEYPHEEEKNRLKDYIINDKRNFTSISYIYNNYGKDILRTIGKIAESNGSTDEESRVIEAYKTIQAFENLAIVINKLWCKIIKAADKNAGKISISQCVKDCKEWIEDIFLQQLIKKLIENQYYNEIFKSYHGTSFDIFISEFTNTEDIRQEEFLVSLIRYHNEIMDKRNSGPWMVRDGSDILVITGYDYPRKNENSKYLHDYKLPNIMNLIEDLGWTPNV